MSADDIFADVIEEPDDLTLQQQQLVDAFFVNGFNKAQAFKTAGYRCSNPEKLGVRVNLAFRSPAVLQAIAARRSRNLVVERQEHTPLDIMIANMEYWFKIATDPAKVGTAESTNARLTAQDCAKDAAPYFHPKLQAIAVSGRLSFDGDVSEEKLDAALADLRRSLEKDGVVFDADGRPVIEGTAREESSGTRGKSRGKPREVQDV